MKTKLRNYYDVLNISPTATPKEISATHKSLAKKYHPDVNKSKDAHKKMILLNEAHDVLSDAGKRAKHDKKLKQTQQQTLVHSADRAEQLRKRAEEKLKTEQAISNQRIEHLKNRSKEKAYQKKQDELIQKIIKEQAESDREQAINLLSMIVRKGNSRLRRNMETDEERHHAIKVLLSLVREDNEHLRKLTEETERKQRIDEILALVKANNEEKIVK